MNRFSDLRDSYGLDRQWELQVPLREKRRKGKKGSRDFEKRVKEALDKLPEKAP